ncbi:hypothetical protein GH714_021421 [Hevea brasiliensis]|uniref:Uncharacterized protein n=1 Tax=Hevea brasiliensis TaxID=3981 RepID=A0A6A6LB90_HEVBR|nr:hypothetical protein GH714_021421 [Hevea brasiliensis]
MRFTAGWRPTGAAERAGELRGPKRGSGGLARARRPIGREQRPAGETGPKRDPSEIVPGTSVAPTVVEQGSRRRRGKSRDPSRAREELGDLETRLAKIELHLIDGDEKVEELDTRIEELDGGMEEFREKRCKGPSTEPSTR